MVDVWGVMRVECGFIFFFFFQAEDGIRDWSVTGVQTCALPIWGVGDRAVDVAAHTGGTKRGHTCHRVLDVELQPLQIVGIELRSEERRVGKECRSRWSPYH